MDAIFRDQLPGALQLLADEIEASAGAEIEVIHDPALRVEMIAEPHWRNGPWPKIRYRDAIDTRTVVYRERFQAFAHELLHLRRQFVDWVPMCDLGIQFRDASGEAVPAGHCGCRGDGLGPADFESLIEHLYVEPALTRYGFGRPDYTGSAAELELLKPRAAFASEIIFRWQYLARWIETDCIGTLPAPKRRASEVLRREGLLAEAVELSSRIRTLLTSPDLVAAKTALVMAIALTFRIPPAGIRLCHYRTDRPGSAKYVPLPQHVSVPMPGGRAPVSLGMAWPAHANN